MRTNEVIEQVKSGIDELEDLISDIRKFSTSEDFEIPDGVHSDYQDGYYDGYKAALDELQNILY